MNSRAGRALIAVVAIMWSLSDSPIPVTAQTNNCKCEIDRSYVQQLVCLDPWCSGGQTFDVFWTYSINDVDCRFDCSDIAQNWALDGCYDQSFTCTGANPEPFSYYYEVWWTFYNPSATGGYFDSGDDSGSTEYVNCGNPGGC